MGELSQRERAACVSAGGQALAGGPLLGKGGLRLRLSLLLGALELASRLERELDCAST